MVLRRRQIVKLTACMIYVIGVLVIGKRIMRVSDSFAFDSHENHYQKHIHHEIAPKTDEFSRRRDQQRVEQKNEWEKWISEWESHIVEGLGEGGVDTVLQGDEAAQAEAIMKKKAMNVLLSDKIPLNRKLRDPRDPLCRNVTYDNSLPSASIIIIFYNEPWSVLLRTVRSSLDGTPARFLKEIILVDDHSNEEELDGRLEYYIETRFPAKVKVIRLKKRLGLIRARLAGAKIASGDVLIFLDAHCEVTKQWIEPLLQRIKENRRAVTTPIIDSISEDTLGYVKPDHAETFQVGGFTWAGHFNWITIQEKDLRSRETRISPTRSPTMAGGLFAIDRLYFWEVGSYDDLMDGWGGENLEMSFRIWQCGGVLEIIPCSRVGHIFRNFHPYEFPEDKDTHGINTARLANVWMDDYKRLFFMHRGELKDNKTAIGDISKRIELRNKLKCKNFQWYLENVYPEKFIPDENVVAYGRAKVRDRNLCLDNLQRDDDKPYALGLYSCHPEASPSQFFSLSNIGELRRDEECAIVSSQNDASPDLKVMMVECGIEGNRDEWIMTEEGKIINVETGLCLDGTNVRSMEDVLPKPCSDQMPGQYWQFDTYVDKISPR